jgi:uncharacterized protein YerC
MGMHEYVVKSLLADKRPWDEIAKETGVPSTTVWRIAKGVTPNPRIRSVQVLHDYFQKQNR